MEPQQKDVEGALQWTDSIFFDVLQHHILDILIVEDEPWVLSMLRTTCSAWYEAMPLPVVFFNGSKDESVKSVLGPLAITQRAVLKSIDTDISDDINKIFATTTRLETLHITLASRSGSTAFVMQFSDCLALNTSIRELHLDWGHIRDVAKYEFATAISEHKTLKRLKIRGESGSMNDIMHSLTKNSTLEELDLQGMRLTEPPMRMLCNALKSNSTITKLNLSGCSPYDIDYNVLELIAEMLTHNSTLTHLDLSFSLHNNDYLLTLADSLKQNTTLRHLGITERERYSFSGPLDVPHFYFEQELGWHRPLMPEFLLAASHLETLILPACNAETMHLIADKMETNSGCLSAIQSLDFGFLGLHESPKATKKFFSCLSQLPALTELSIDEFHNPSYTQPDTVLALRDYIDDNKGRLKVLRISGLYAPGEIYGNLLDSLTAANSIQRLVFAHMAFEPACHPSFADFCNTVTSLKELQIRDCRIQSVSAFAASLASLSCMESLTLWNVAVSATTERNDMFGIPRLLSPQLRRLHLATFTISPEDGFLLANSLNANNSLIRFELSSLQTRANIEGINCLERVPAACPHMQKLICNGIDMVAAHRRRSMFSKANEKPLSPPTSPRDAQPNAKPSIEAEPHKKDKKRKEDKCITS